MMLTSIISLFPSNIIKNLLRNFFKVDYIFKQYFFEQEYISNIYTPKRWIFLNAIILRKVLLSIRVKLYKFLSPIFLIQNMQYE